MQILFATTLRHSFHCQHHGSRMLMVFVLSAVVVFLVSVVIIMGVVRCQNPILLDLVDICFLTCHAFFTAPSGEDMVWHGR